MLGYFSTKYMDTTSPIQHLQLTSMTTDGVWATDVEIVAMSLLLKTDIYVAQKRSKESGSGTHIHWLRYQGSLENTKENSVYISNFDDHFQPVIRLIESEVATYTNADSLVECMVIDE